MKINKDFLLNKSKVFCMFPWLHLNVAPNGTVYPCCNNQYDEIFGDLQTSNLEQIFNNDKMKMLRLNMLNEKKSSFCKQCYKSEEVSDTSYRKFANGYFGGNFDQLIHKTWSNGFVDDFKMMYVDVRFSNLCNFKCRTCGDFFSSKWSEEMYPNSTRSLVKYADSSGETLNYLISQIPNFQIVYFAGGEPLIMPDHYVLLEEMIRSGKSKDIMLRYNTNLSTLKYKKIDIFDIWKKFKKVELSVSIDHYGKRAEYIRHGTNWEIVYHNLKTVRNADFINFSINSVISLFNYLTLDDFILFLIQNGILQKEDLVSFISLQYPYYFSTQVMPKELKMIANKKNLELHKKIEKYYFAPHILSAINYAEEKNSWYEYKDKLLYHINDTDKVRKEDFKSTFPELSSIFD